MKAPALLRRLPRLRLTRGERAHLVPPDEREAYPALAEDFEFLDEELMPAFAELDELALSEQNAFRLQRLLLIVGSLLAAVFGAVQAALEDRTWPGLVVLVAGAVSTAVAWTARERGSMDSYLQGRLKAERLRALYFAFLGEVEPYRGPRRRRQLIADVAAIKHGKEPT